LSPRRYSRGKRRARRSTSPGHRSASHRSRAVRTLECISLDLSWLRSDGVAWLAVVSGVSGAWLGSGAVSPVLRSLVAGAGGSVSGERDEALVAGGDEICPGPSLGETQDASTPGGDQARGHGPQPQSQAFGFPGSGGLVVEGEQFVGQAG